MEIPVKRDLAKQEPPTRVTHVDWYPWLLAVVVLLSRLLTRFPLYYGDGPKHIRAIQTHSFVIQPPGYWLFNRLAGLFSDPALAISLFNIFCSTMGVVVFYYCARDLLTKRSLARWGAAIYAAIFYAWFSAEVHSTYASQLLFPVLALYLFFEHQRTGRARYLYFAAAAFAIGAGLRPSDGAFLLPFVLWQLIRCYPRRRAVVAAALITALCLAWLVPNVLALERAKSWSSSPADTVGSYASLVLSRRSIVWNGINKLTLANVTRVVVAICFAFWPFLLPLVFSGFRGLDSRARELALWIFPGLLFFLATIFSEAPYLNFATAAILLMGLMLLENSTRRLTIATAVLCLAWNIGFFLFFKPMLTMSMPINTVNCYAGRFTLFSLRHRAFPNLSDVVKDPSLLFRPTE